MSRLKANLICECGKPAFAAGKCRSCYDKSRVYPRFALARDVQDPVMALAKEKGWGYGRTINALVRMGLKFKEKQAEIAKEYDLGTDGKPRG